MGGCGRKNEYNEVPSRVKAVTDEVLARTLDNIIAGRRLDAGSDPDQTVLNLGLPARERPVSEPHNYRLELQAARTETTVREER